MGLNILVVDDSLVMRHMIIKTLRLSGLPVNELHQASNGLEGLQAIESHWIDLALVDLNMPIMDGEEMIGRIRSNPETVDLPIIVVSSEGSETRISELKKQGVEFVHKPFTPEGLRQTVFNMTGVGDGDRSEDRTL
jgi:two-component system, chemotaxis family, chemotaxis protein CheY